MENAQKQEQVKYYEKAHSYLNVVDTPYARSMVDRVIKKGQISKDSEILEIGCGTGRFTFTLIKKGYKITGLDVSPNLINRLKARLTGDMQTKLILETAEEAAPKYKEKFDYIIGFHVLHHIHQLESLMQAVNVMLKPSGRIIFVEPNPLGPLFYIQTIVVKDINWEREKGILNITPKKIKTLLIKTGFTDIEVKRFGVFPPALFKLPTVWTMDRIIEKLIFINPLLIFQMISAKKT